MFAFALVALPGALLGALATRNASAALEAQAGSALAREADHTAEYLSSVLRGERQTLSSFARQDLMRDVRVADVDKRVSMALATLRARDADAHPGDADAHPGAVDARLGDEGAHEYFVLDDEQRVVAASQPAAIGSLPSWATKLRGTAGADTILGPFGAPIFDAPRVLMSSAIPDPDDPSRSLGTLVGAFHWGSLTAVLGTVQQDLAAQRIPADVVVCDASGVILGGVFAGSGDERAAEPEGAARGLGREPDWIGLRHRIIGRASLAQDLPRWGVLVIERRSHALAPVTSLQRRMALTLGLALALALAAAAIASRRVGRPLSELTAAIRGLARGGAQSVPVRSDDELGALAGAFNRMSSELARAQHDLVEAEKFAFVGELAAGVAHEIRTSLGVLKSSAQIIDRSLPADANAQLRELTGMVRDEVARLGSVVDDLLTLKPERTPRLEPGPLSPLLARAAEFARHAAREKNVRVVCAEPPANEPTVAREPELIHQVAVNLLVNAVQALEEGGTVEIAVLTALGGRGGFEVRDDGPGIPEALRERIFQPFVTGRSGGVGLGLTFVKRVVHEHRGRITLDSAPGAGTRVRIELPLAEEAR